MATPRRCCTTRLTHKSEASSPNWERGAHPIREQRPGFVSHKEIEQITFDESPEVGGRFDTTTSASCKAHLPRAFLRVRDDFSELMDAGFGMLPRARHSKGLVSPFATNGGSAKPLGC